MPVTSSDIVFVLSGGVSNTNPLQSLGGHASIVGFVSNAINNLFDDVSGTDATNGKTDYRCFYIFNNNLTSSLTNVTFWIDSQVSGGATVLTGISLNNEHQLLTFTNNPTGGTFQLTLDLHQTGTITYDTNPNNLAINIQNAIQALSNGAGASVSFNNTLGGFDIIFSSPNNNRWYPLITMSVNNLIPGTTQTPGFLATKITSGSPINTIAVDIGNSSVPPTGITFINPTSTNPLTIGNLNSADGFPVWLQRVVPVQSDSVANDGLTVKLTGDTI